MARQAEATAPIEEVAARIKEYVNDERKAFPYGGTFSFGLAGVVKRLYSDGYSFGGRPMTQAAAKEIIGGFTIKRGGAERPVFEFYKTAERERFRGHTANWDKFYNSASERPNAAAAF